MRYDFCIVGAGIVGLATARDILRRRPGASLVLLEKESEVATHQTGHNSGVIHAGVYYAPGSLKARLCREGNRSTIQFCAQHGIPVDVCGKLIVATTPLEVSRLAELRERCEANEIIAREISGADLSVVEPRIAGLAGLLIPSTGIVDYRRVSRALADGLQSDRLARASGLDIKLRIIPFRLHPYPAGVRAQAVLPDGTLVHDFMFADTPLLPGHRSLRLRKLGHDAHRMGIQKIAFVGDRRPARVAVDQAHAQAPFEAGQPLADHGQGQTQLGRRGGEAFERHDALEGLQAG